jgi:hypothetical protein
MTRITLILAATMLAAAGCTPTYRVHFNGYSELNEPIDRDAPMHVATDPNSENLVFHRQVKDKAERLLDAEGYTVAATQETAAYEITFRVGTMTRETIDRTARVGLRGGFYGGYSRGYAFGPTFYQPYYDTEYRQWLVFRLFRLQPDAPEPRHLVWVGEATLQSDRAAIRELVDYLLVACVEYLGIDTREEITLTIERDDPRVMEIAGQP